MLINQDKKLILYYLHKRFSIKFGSQELDLVIRNIKKIFKILILKLFTLNWSHSDIFSDFVKK